jgi:hypothetical protein
MGNARTWAKWAKWTGVAPGHLATFAPIGEQAGPFCLPVETINPCKWRYISGANPLCRGKRDSPVYIPVYILDRSSSTLKQPISAGPKPAVISSPHPHLRAFPANRWQALDPHPIEPRASIARRLRWPLSERSLRLPIVSPIE